MNPEHEICEICLKVKHIADMQKMADGYWMCEECLETSHEI